MEALKGAIAEAKAGVDVKQYEAAVAALHDIAPNDPDAKADMSWVDRMTKHVKAETDRLELELKGYKNNLIKESIRVGFFPKVTWETSSNERFFEPDGLR